MIEYIGVGFSAHEHYAVPFTNQNNDFAKFIQKNLNATIADYNKPVVLVVKKNKSILESVSERLQSELSEQGLDSKSILIIDDELSKNQLMQRIYKAAAPAGVTVVLMNQEDAAKFLFDDPEKGENIMILVKVPQVLEKFIDQGFETNKIILGGMGANEKRKRFNRNISASEEELDCFRRIIARGIKIVYQLIPNDREVDIKDLL